MKIETTNYMSTNDFVHQNKLQDIAEELFGKDWVAENDVEQIEKLLDKVAPNKYMVTCYGAMFRSDYDIEVRELDCTTNFSTEELRKELTRRGYQTDNLWHTDDVKIKYDCDSKEAQEVLIKALENEATIEQVRLAIDIIADEMFNLKKKDELR